MEDEVNSELLGLMTGKRRQEGAKSRVSELFSSSSEDEAGLVSNGSHGVTEPRPTSSRRKAHPEEEEEQDVFSDGYALDLMGDAEDRRKLAAMTEIEREAILYERAQARLAKTERKELERKIRELESGSRPSRGPSASMEKKRKTLEELRARRERRGRKDSDSDYEEDGEVKEGNRHRGRQQGSDDSEFEALPTIKARPGKGNVKQMSSLELIDLSMANDLRIPRSMISKWIFHPNFDEICRGCLLRLSITSKGEQVYRVVEIKKIAKYHKNYRIDGVICNKAATMKYGKLEKTFTFDIISNSPFTAAEFERWMDTLKEEGQPCMSKKVAENRIKAWRDLENTPVSDEIISAMVAARREIGAAPRSFLSERTTLQHLRDEALASGNHAEISRIDEELEQLNREQLAHTAKTGGDSKLDAFAELNRRNRMLNVAAAKEAEKLYSKRSETESRLDPFSRRKCQPSNYNDLGDNVESEASVKPVANLPETIAPAAGEQSMITEPANAIPDSEYAKTSKPQVDLFAVHNIDIDIDL